LWLLCPHTPIGFNRVKIKLSVGGRVRCILRDGKAVLTRIAACHAQRLVDRQEGLIGLLRRRTCDTMSREEKLTEVIRHLSLGPAPLQLDHLIQHRAQGEITKPMIHA